MRKKRSKKLHAVRAHMQILELTKAGSSMTLDIFASKEKIGTIVIGRGSMTWYGRKRKIGKAFSWSRFSEIMDSHAYPA